MTPITFATLHEHTAQQVFDFVVTRIIEQGVPSIVPGGACAYAGVEGRSCAVGQLVPDRSTAERMDDALGSLPWIWGYRGSTIDAIDVTHWYADLGWQEGYWQLPVDFGPIHGHEAMFDGCIHAHEPLLKALQGEAHDKAAGQFKGRLGSFVSLFKENARNVAKAFGLDPKVAL